MIRKVDLGLLRCGDLVRFVDLELADTWAVKKIGDGEIVFGLNSVFEKREKILKINPNRKRYVFVEVG